MSLIKYKYEGDFQNGFKHGQGFLVLTPKQSIYVLSYDSDEELAFAMVFRLTRFAHHLNLQLNNKISEKETIFKGHFINDLIKGEGQLSYDDTLIMRDTQNDITLLEGKILITTRDGTLMG